VWREEPAVTARGRVAAAFLTVGGRRTRAEDRLLGIVKGVLTTNGKMYSFASVRPWSFASSEKRRPPPLGATAIAWAVMVGGSTHGHSWDH
jgi:hypothetical protein